MASLLARFIPFIPPSLEYQLTPKGKDARKMFTAMIDWKNRW
ncbi:hypothetical protein EQU42_05670 [Lactobacillus sanfranciscensis]|nr:hypothetical protein [Fructilactobacillus sanfranciscensis]